MPEILIFVFIAFIAASVVAFINHRRSSRIIQSQDRLIKELRSEVDGHRLQSTTERGELNVILSSMVEGVLVVGKDEKIQYISPNLFDMFDFRSKEVAAKPYWEVIPDGQIISAMKSVMSTGVALSREITIYQKDNIFFNMQISPVFNDGMLRGAVVVFHDISELKRLLRMRSEFVANVSHELKTPLTSIKGYVETLIESETVDHATLQKFLKIIHKQSLRLEALVKDLLTLSSIESKEVSMDLQTCDVASIIQSSLNITKGSLEALKHHVTVNIPKDLPKIFVDRYRMEQVIINLLDNAAKFTPPGGKIDFIVSHQGAFLKIDVKDSGIGIAREHLPRLFERFYRVDKSRSAELGGTGLGLAIVKHIVLAHQGRVEVQSKLGSGTTFSIFLPVCKN